MKIYIHEKENWSDFTWDNKKVMIKLGEARNQQGRHLGKMESLGFDLQNETILNTLTLDVIKSSEIEGEFLDIEQNQSFAKECNFAYTRTTKLKLNLYF